MKKSLTNSFLEANKKTPVKRQFFNPARLMDAQWGMW